MAARVFEELRKKKETAEGTTYRFSRARVVSDLKHP